MKDDWDFFGGLLGNAIKKKKSRKSKIDAQVDKATGKKKKKKKNG